MKAKANNYSKLVREVHKPDTYSTQDKISQMQSHPDDQSDIIGLSNYENEYVEVTRKPVHKSPISSKKQKGSPPQNMDIRASP